MPGAWGRLHQQRRFPAAPAGFSCIGVMEGARAPFAVLETHNLLVLGLFMKYLNEKKIAVQ